MTSVVPLHNYAPLEKLKGFLKLNSSGVINNHKISKRYLDKYLLFAIKYIINKIEEIVWTILWKNGTKDIN